LKFFCTYSCAHQCARSAHVGVCGVKVFSRQQFRQKLITPAQHLRNKSSQENQINNQKALKRIARLATSSPELTTTLSVEHAICQCYLSLASLCWDPSFVISE
jgi:hypothetical protein